jgi:hypothetical protein
MIIFDKYLVWKCPNCNKWQGKQNNKFTIGMSELSKSDALNKLNLKCISEKCQKTIKFKDNTKGGVRVLHHWCKLPNEAKLLIQEMERQKGWDNVGSKEM